ncbi:MAG: OmpA family protein [Candidatus Poribacteria bacterium]|nr:OmpA family protein [Candidatus Poribacteria bacterium]
MSRIERLCAAVCLLLTAGGAGCGAGISKTQVEEAYQHAEASYRAAEGAEESPAYSQARRLFEEAQTLLQEGENRLAHDLFERARHYADLAAAQAEEADAEAKRNRALAAYMNALIAEGRLKGEAAAARWQLERALRERAESDAEQARQEAQASQRAAEAAKTQAEEDAARLLAETALALASRAVQLAAQANAATLEPSRFEDAQKMEAEARRLLASGDARQARLQALDAYREADDLRVSSIGKQAARRAQESRALADAAGAAGWAIGAAEGMLKAAEEYRQGAPKLYQDAKRMVQEASDLYNNNSYELALGTAEKAEYAAALAYSEGRAALSSVLRARTSEEQAALVKDISRLMTARAEALPNFAKARFETELGAAGSLAALAASLMEIGDLNLAARNAEAASDILNKAETWARQVQADEAALLEAGSKIEGAVVFSAQNGVAFRISGALFAGDSSEIAPAHVSLIQKIAETARPFLKRYHIEVNGYSERLGNVDAEDRLSKERAESVGRILAAALGVELNSMNASGRGSRRQIEGLPPQDARNRRVEAVVRTRGLEKESPDAPSDH